MRKRISQFLKWIKYWFWSHPAKERDDPKATDVVKNWTIINYHGQNINLHQHEVPMWNSLSRKDKRAMKHKFEVMEKRGEIKFVEIDGKLTCVKNKDYQAKADKLKAEQTGRI